MDGYSWIALLTLIVTVVAVWMIRKRKEYKYSMLDTSGIILNAVLIVMIYPPLSVVGALFEIGQFATEPLSIFLEGATIAMGRLMPAISVAGIGASVILRRKEKPGLSFLIQFAGGMWFCIMMLLARLSGSY
ncbi:MAG: hypothetical protein IIV13_07830 [Bacteroidaceae bacterium]|jgi:hypothetical protein|nr:hypothetical protein [Bacteroidaceae bacterium]